MVGGKWNGLCPPSGEAMAVVSLQVLALSWTSQNQFPPVPSSVALVQDTPGKSSTNPLPFSRPSWLPGAVEPEAGQGRAHPSKISKRQ